MNVLQKIMLPEPHVFKISFSNWSLNFAGERLIQGIQGGLPDRNHRWDKIQRGFFHFDCVCYGCVDINITFAPTIHCIAIQQPHLKQRQIFLKWGWANIMWNILAVEFDISPQQSTSPHVVPTTKSWGWGTFDPWHYTWHIEEWKL